MTHSAILILFNPAARGGKSHLKLKAYTHYLVSQKLAFTIYETNGTRDAEDLALRFHENNYTAVSIIGGDGTLNLALNCLPHLDIPIHLTGQDFTTGHIHVKALLYDPTHVLVPSILKNLVSH